MHLLEFVGMLELQWGRNFIVAEIEITMEKR